MNLKTLCKDGLVSTVDLFGIPHTWTEPGNYFFETGVKISDGEWEIIERYRTEREAIAGHSEIVKQLGGRSALNFLAGTTRDRG